jgi:hypothetical protein
MIVKIKICERCDNLYKEYGSDFRYASCRIDDDDEVIFEVIRGQKHVNKEFSIPEGCPYLLEHMLK